MSISEPFIRRPIATSLLMGGIFLVGCVVYPLLPVAPLPQVDFPTIQVTAQLPGASPETMAATVATPLEYQFAADLRADADDLDAIVLGTTHHAAVRSGPQHRRGRAGRADRHQRGRRPAAEEPADAAHLQQGQSRRLADPDPRRCSSDVLPVTTVDDYAENILAQQISQIPGVAQVSIGGQQKPAVRVQIDPAKLAALGLQLEDVASVIGIATVDAPKGSINGAAAQLRRSTTTTSC